MFKKMVILIISVSLILPLSGCVVMMGAAVGGAGTAFWLSGKLTDTVNVSYERTLDATKKALKSMDMEIEKETSTDEVTQLISEYADGRKVWIDVRPLSSSSTKLEIRVGMKGDKSLSSQILEKIKKNL